MSFSTITLSTEQVLALLKVQEGHFLDLKSVDVSPSGLTEAVSAFSNTSGGELFIGVDELVGNSGLERRWRGFENVEAANGLIQAIEAMSPLGNHYSVEFMMNESYLGLVAHITAFKSKDILYASNGRAYVRRGAQKLPVQGEEAFRRLRYDKGLTSFEDERINLPLSEISNSATVIDFLIHVVPSAEPDVWLEKQRLVVDGQATVAGILLFCDEPQAVLPKRSAVKIFQYKTRTAAERDTLAFDPVTIEGPMYDVIYDAVDRCKEIVEAVQKLGATGLENISYPEEALHEIITNAVLHRDYSVTADVQVRIFDNRIEIESPGRFPGHITAVNVLTEQFARNPKLVRLINKFPDAPNKDVGEGLNTAFEAMNKLRLKPPLITERDNSVLVTLRHESLGLPETLVMDYVNSHGSITNSTARELTGIKSENSMKNVFIRLKNKGLLEPVPDRAGASSAWRKTI